MGNPTEQPSARDFDHAPLPMKLVFAAAGLLIMLLATGVIPADPTNFRSPHWVVFAVGLMFFLAAVLLFMGRHRLVHPACYMFIAATMCTSLAAVVCWVAVWSTGPFSGGLALGPLALRSTGSPDMPARALFGAAALVTAFLSVLGWIRWWHALRDRATASSS